jgi:hypothetical protein
MIDFFEADPTMSIGYAGLVRLYAIRAFPHYRKSFLIKGTPYTECCPLEEIYYYPKKYFPKDLEDPLNHLEFALKYEGVNFEILRSVFQQIEPKIIENYVSSQPTSKLARKIWFLYEYLTSQELDLSNASGGSYTLLLDPQKYYTNTPIRSRRHYIDNNLLGNIAFCPLVRRTPKLTACENKQLSEVAKQLIAKYDAILIARAVNFL